MREYPKSLYFSASWHEADQRLSLLVAKSFASKGFLVVGDHPFYRDHPHERNLDYPARIAEILEDCSGIVVFWPKRDLKQTTSPYMFTEPLYASRSELPVFILYIDGVTIKVQQEQDETILAFGGATKNSSVLSIDNLLKQGYSDQLVEATYRISIKKPPSLVGPISVPADPDQFGRHEQTIAEAIQRFADSLPPPPKPKFVFNIIPFAQQRRHQEIARVVLEETGLPCFTAEDHRDSKEDVTDKWRSYLDGSAFVIADLSKHRETCSLETGIALGKDKPLFIVSKRPVKKLPYGTHTRPVETYNSIGQLCVAVRKFCRPYRRRIISVEIVKGRIGSPQDSGLPSWYFDKFKFNLGSKLLIFGFLLSLGGAILVAAFVHTISPDKSRALIIAGVFMTIFAITVSSSSRIQQLLENLIAKKINLYIGSLLSR